MERVLDVLNGKLARTRTVPASATPLHVTKNWTMFGQSVTALRTEPIIHFVSYRLIVHSVRCIGECTMHQIIGYLRCTAAVRCQETNLVAERNGQRALVVDLMNLIAFMIACVPFFFPINAWCSACGCAMVSVRNVWMRSLSTIYLCSARMPARNLISNETRKKNEKRGVSSDVFK